MGYILQSNCEKNLKKKQKEAGVGPIIFQRYVMSEALTSDSNYRKVFNFKTNQKM